MRTKISLFAVLLTAAAFCGSQLVYAANQTVGTCPGPGIHYPTSIQAAVNAAAPGSTVDICPGTWAEQVTINKALTLQGITFGTQDAAVIVPPSGGVVANGVDLFGNPVAAQIFVATAGATVNVKSLTVDGTGNNFAGCSPPSFAGIWYSNTAGTISNNTVRNQYQTDYANYGGCQNGLGIYVESRNLSPAVTISHNSVRAYQKNGITVNGNAPDAGGPVATITANFVIGLAATAMNFQTGATAAENGIQVGFGAKGSVSSNVVDDNIWKDDTVADPGDAASGILVYASQGIGVMHNDVGSAQFGIAIETDSYGFCGMTGDNKRVSCGTADNATVSGNKIAGTQIFDGIDLCSSNDTANSNTILGSAESAIHIDSECTNADSVPATSSGNSDTVTNNFINEACAGILLGDGTGQTISPNTFYNVTNTTVSGDVCTAETASVRQLARARSYRPSPFHAGVGKRR